MMLMPLRGTPETHHMMKWKQKTGLMVQMATGSAGVCDAPQKKEYLPQHAGHPADSH